ncbi:MAG: SAM-dependent methyltransferase [Gammaproteobacteria bacterium]|nr:SAM-dependent methyltransferase [Gammaproteobacteria bacterium]
MSRKTLNLSERLHDYLLSVSLREPELLQRLRAETAREPQANMQIAPEQGQLLALLVQLIGARRTLEIGVYTGYSSLWVGLVLPPQGRIVACDNNEAWTAVARRYWEEAGIAHKVDLRLGEATDTLAQLIDEEEGGAFDFAFIDADKENYDTYYERCLELLRPGGLVAIDNVLWGGRVADPEVRDGDTMAIRALNEKLQADARVYLSLVPIADGLTLAYKLP